MAKCGNTNNEGRRHMRYRLLGLCLTGILILGTAACSPASTPPNVAPIPDKPTLTEGEVIANVQMKGIPMLALTNAEPGPTWSARYMGKGEWEVVGYVTYRVGTTSTRRSVKRTWRYYERTGGVRLL